MEDRLLFSRLIVLKSLLLETSRNDTEIEWRERVQLLTLLRLPCDLLALNSNNHQKQRTSIHWPTVIDSLQNWIHLLHDQLFFLK
jgi:hypothetical protein